VSFTSRDVAADFLSISAVIIDQASPIQGFMTASANSLSEISRVAPISGSRLFKCCAVRYWIGF